MRDTYRELITAALLVCLGLVYGGWAYLNYDLGTLRRIGPGMFPVGLGGALVVIGVLLALPAIGNARRRQDMLPIGGDETVAVADESEPPEGSVRSGVFVLLSLVAFAFVLPVFGTAPALFALVFTAVLAERGRDWLVTPALLASALCVLVWLLFKVALNLPLVMLKWPF